MNDEKNKRGVFGEGVTHCEKKRNSSSNKVPVIDVIGVGITIVIMGFVVIYFDEITDSLFQILLPIVTNFFLIVIVLLAFIFFVWHRTTSRRRW